MQLRRPSRREPVHLVVDATGLGIVGQGQWAAAKWGERRRRGWRKLHVAADQGGNILAVELTDASVADARAFPGLLEQVPNPVIRLTADGGYDRREVYEAARKRGAKTVIPPRRDAVVSRAPVLSDRDAHLERICDRFMHQRLASVHPSNLGDGDVALVDDDQPVVRKVLDQGRRRLAPLRDEDYLSVTRGSKAT